MHLESDWHNKIFKLVILALAGFAVIFILFLEGKYFSPDVLMTLLFVSVVFSIVLIAVNISQYYDIKRHANDIAHELADNMLADTHDLFSALYKHSPVPYILIEVDGTITSTNFAALRLFNIELGELNGKNIFNYIDDDAKGRVSMFPSMLEAGIFINDEEVTVAPVDGEKKWALLSLFSFLGENQKRQGLLTLVDITKRKEVDIVKSEFVSLASHQLLTPVSAAKWNLELLASESPKGYTEVQREYMVKMGKIIERMNTLVHDFLNVSRLELGRLTATKEPTNIKKLLDDILLTHAKLVAEKDLQITQKIDKACAEVQSDPKMLTNVFDNLISNAIKYSHNGGTITITTLKERDIACLVSITDAGIGIPADEQDEIFSKIFRASNAHKHGTSGTGLGLYIAREMMKVLGGTITFVSKEGKGTTFSVTLPRQ